MICVFFLAFFLPLIWADCPPGTIYESSFNKCYKFVNQSLSFLAAEQFCVGLGGHLVAISNGFEASTILVDVIGTPQSLSYWIGANYLLAPNWSWTFNTPFSYSNWAPGQPADPSSTQCGAVRTPDNYWTKELCFSLKPFVCAIDPNAVPVGSPTCPPTPTCPVCTMISTTVSTTCPPEPTGNLTCPGRCPARYTQNPMDCKCYNLFQEPKLDFNDASDYCKSINASLIKITTAAQNRWISDWLVSLGLTSCFPYIGLTCPRNTIESCFWTDGSDVSCYSNFDTLEFPSDQLGQNAATKPNFLLRLDPNCDDYGMWIRDNELLCVLCMRGLSFVGENKVFPDSW